MDCRISVALAAYNGEKYIREQLDSILKQLSDDDELVISLNESTDRTAEILESYLSDSRVRLFLCKEKGILANFENAIKHCSGDIICLSDQDDIWMKNKSDVIRKHFNETDCLLMVHDCVVIDEQRNIIEESFFRYNHSRKGIFRNIIKNSFMGCCMAFRKELVQHIIPIPEDVPMHDQWIGLKAQQKGEVAFDNEKLLMYRRHNSNVSKMKHMGLIEMIMNRVRLIRRVFLK